MKTSTHTTVCRRISLELSEQFFVRLTRSFRWSVNMIEVHPGYFSIYGGPGANRTNQCKKLEHEYRSPDEIPGMPPHVADDVQRALDELAPEQPTT